ncbi:MULTISPECIES: EamA family transporter RarD [unclassified Undibacterium]|uniref:EamA family transporter RarD n=1 Tax=unclassified Undibacterium TaxID=2630295 RepID=UPI002AC93E7F|nr:MULTISPECIES: EamA family transporter RarD [unclassified Undibacterium]MEB0140037.1 EamA family transporter RarD [Undibacterium sp. CCC2.1]MEB0173050.1 EamA family transporter RarD [Undibacterium sp. CCC1.1]MEB0176862.1 EamA family transporter RarD [Undibacterium sp. CCC3.4]MEB0216094.1 EamA family transporter RarD [Undibacterium sp. 5I2]WPX42023.1 EamA family transporter RarD [Undibacterium sp. CCC3.4]
MRKGILLAGSAYTLWGLFPVFFKLLHTVPSLEILLNRMIWSLLFLMMVLAARRQWSWIDEARRQPRLIARFIFSALFLSSNWFVYIWAINDGRVIDTSLGYFMTPLVNILIGSVFLKERLRTGQWIAIALAAVGVCWMTLQTGHLPWVALVLAATFGTYGLLRKTAPLGALEGLSLETALLFPFAIAYLAWLTWHGQNALLSSSTEVSLLLVLAGPVTAIPLLLFAAGARRLPMTTLGFLQYIAPSVQLLLAILVFHEVLDPHKLLGFAAIWLGLLIFSAEGLWVGWRSATR